MKLYLPPQTLLAALVMLTPTAWAEIITSDTEYKYGSSAWATDSYFKFDEAAIRYIYMSSPAKEYTMIFSGGKKGVFVNAYYDPEKKEKTPVFDYLSFEQLKEVCFYKNEANHDGGAIFSYIGNISLNNNGNVNFSENKVTATINFDGGGAISSVIGNIAFNNNYNITFSENESIENGGAVHSRDGDITLNNNRNISFSENKAKDSGGAISTVGGDISILNNGNVIFQRNIAETLTGGALQTFNIGTLDNNGNLSFIENKAKDGGAIHFAGGTINNNKSVNFIGNIASVNAGNATSRWAYGGAIYAASRGVSLNNNGSVTFSRNKATGIDNFQSNDIRGGAIYSTAGDISLDCNSYVNFSENSAGSDGGAIYGEKGSISLSNNGNISFSKNTSGTYGGAIFTSGGTIGMSHNASVMFIGNVAYRGGGAIQSFNLVTLHYNGNISFSGNMGGDGGAIHASGIILSNNTGDISFSGNKAPGTEPYAKGDGGAIFYSGLGLTITDNKGTVKFSGNRANRWGGAIYCYRGNAVIANNKEVIFEGNIAAPDGIDRLCSIHLGNEYADAGVPAPILTLSAPQDGAITVKDSIYAVDAVELNKTFDHDGDASTAALAQSGIITFSGASAESDLNNYFITNNIKDTDGNIRKATAAEITASRISRIGGAITLYAGTLEVVDGAVLSGADTYDTEGKTTGHRNGTLILAEGSNASLSMRDAVIDKETTLNAGTNLKLQGANTVKSLTLNGDAKVTFVVDNVNSTQAVLSLSDKQTPTLNPDTISVVAAKTNTRTDTYLLITTNGITTTGVSTQALNTSDFYWSNGNLYYNYVNPVSKLDTVAASYNGQAGAKLLLAAHQDTYAEDGALVGIFESAVNRQINDKELAAVAGASSAALGQAFSSDVERQLHTIRNRSAAETFGFSMKADDYTFFAWINAEGDRGEQNNDDTAAGHTLSSWGGTVGAGTQVNNRLTLGLALSAMCGDLKSDGPDYLNGDMDTTYLSAFVRYSKDNWNHAVIGIFGSTDADYHRIVNHTSGSYTTHGNTEGTSFGLMYEMSYDYAINDTSNISPAINITYRHTKVDAYDETGNDAALSVGDQNLITATLGLGVRYKAAIGAPTRACNFEARAFAKYDFGDTQSKTNVSFINHSTRADIKSAELSAFGLELGAGISVPVGFGNVFLDGAAELRNDYVSFNTTAGYSIQF